jgi:hypothetical protein
MPIDRNRPSGPLSKPNSGGWSLHDRLIKTDKWSQELYLKIQVCFFCVDFSLLINMQSAVHTLCKEVLNVKRPFQVQQAESIVKFKKLVC